MTVKDGAVPHFICTTCGTQYAESGSPPAACAVCQDERQYVKKTGQQWTTLAALRLSPGTGGSNETRLLRRFSLGLSGAR